MLDAEAVPFQGGCRRRIRPLMYVALAELSLKRVEVPLRLSQGSRRGWLRDAEDTRPAFKGFHERIFTSTPGDSTLARSNINIG